MTTNATFQAGDVGGLLFEPIGAGKAPALVLLQEWWGLNQHIRDLGERLGAEGFVVVVPDLKHGKGATNQGEGARVRVGVPRRRPLGGGAWQRSLAFLKTHLG